MTMYMDAYLDNTIRGLTMIAITITIISATMISLSVAGIAKRKAEYTMSLKEKIIDMLGGITKEEHLERRKNAYVEGYSRAEREVSDENIFIQEEAYRQGFIEGYEQAEEDLDAEIDDLIDIAHEDALYKGLTDGFNMGYDSALQEEIDRILGIDDDCIQFDFDDEEHSSFVDDYGEGYDDGYDDGFEDGYSHGHAHGFNSGVDVGTEKAELQEFSEKMKKRGL